MEPETMGLAGLGSVALVEGVKFLYAQVTELLRWRREKAKEKRVGRLPDVDERLLDGAVDAGAANPAALDTVADRLAAIRKELADYVDDIKPVQATDRSLIDLLEEVRALVERVYGQHLTFRTETGRPATGTALQTGVAGDVGPASRVVSAQGTGSIAIGGNNPGIARTEIHNA
jgi:hypothetical protein